MIVNEIAKLENELQARLRSCLYPKLGEPLLVTILNVRHSHSPREKRSADPANGDANAASGRKSRTGGPHADAAQSRSNPRNRSQSVTAASNASSSTCA